MPRSLLSGRRRGGRFGHRLSEVERTILPCFTLSGSHSLRSCPAAPAKERDRLFDGASTPPFQAFQGGEWAFPTTAILDPVFSGRLVGKCSPLQRRGDGVVGQTYACCERPPRPLRSKVASQHFLEVASTPPLQGGEYASGCQTLH